MAVEPDGRCLHRAVEAQCALPDAGLAGVALSDVGQHEGALALLHQPCGAAEGTAGEGRRIINNGTRGRLRRGARGLLRAAALHPRGGVDGQDVRLGTFLDGNRLVLIARDEQVVAGGRDGGADLGAAVEHQWGRSLGDALQFAEEVADVRRLVVAHTLPCHAVAILMVVPEGVDAVVRGVVRRVDVECRVVAGAQHELLAPVADDVALGRRVVLRRVVEDARGGVESRAVVERHSAIAPLGDLDRALHAGRVHDLVAEVAVPVDAVVQVAPSHVGVAVGIDDLVGRESYDAGGDGASLAAGNVVGEVAGEAAAVVGAWRGLIVDLARGGVVVAVVRHGQTLETGELLQSPAVGVEVAAVLCVAVAVARGA